MAKSTSTTKKTSTHKKNSIPLAATNASNDKKLIECVTTNLTNLMEVQGITGKQLSEETGYSEAAICKYKNGKLLPPIDFLYKVQKLYDISIDDFISRPILVSAPIASPLEKAREIEDIELGKKYIGNYLVYYLDTSNYKGRDNNPACKSLVYGVISITEVETIDKPEFKCLAVLGIENRDDATLLKEKLDEFKDEEALTSYITFDVDSHNIDRALIVLYRVDTNKEIFNGGLGVINSGSKGRERMPTAQFMGFSRYPLTLSEEEIHHELLLTYPTLKADQEIKELINFFKNTYLVDNPSNSIYTEYQKELMLKTTIEYYIKKIIERNMDRYAKASERDDHNWYKILKYDEEKRLERLNSTSNE